MRLNSIKNLKFRRWKELSQLSQRRIKIASAGLTSILTGTLILTNIDDIIWLSRAIPRSLRTLTAVGVTAIDYKFNFKEDEDSKHRVHSRSAKRMLKLFEANGGVYIKFGQHLAALQYLIPKEYCTEMSVLHNRAPKSSIGEVRTVFKEETGYEIEEIFQEFDTEPIGTASLAQVHTGILKTGEKVAIKVQHAKLKDLAPIDIAETEKLSRFIKWEFPGFELDWLASEMKMNLPKEMDFVNEGLNAERAAENFKKDSRVRIPKIHWKYTRQRVLVMELLVGNKITDIDYLKANNLNAKRISEKFASIFSKMVFIDRFVHCDPHPGNIFIRVKHGNPFLMFFNRLLANDWEIILLDHGLYKTLSKSFIRDYSFLWKSILDGNEEEIKKYSLKLGGGDAYRLFSCILSQKGWESIQSSNMNRPETSQDIDFIQQNVGQYLPEIAHLLAHMSRDILLLLKTNDLVRSVDRILTEGSSMNTFIIMARYIHQSIYASESENQSFLKKSSLYVKYLLSRVQLFFMEYFLYFSLLKNKSP